MAEAPDNVGKTSISRFMCKVCNGFLIDPEDLPCGCKCCGRCYHRSVRASATEDFTCPIPTCRQVMCITSVRQGPKRTFLYSPRGVAPYPDNGYAKVHTDAAAIEITKYSSSEQQPRFYTYKHFLAQFRVTKGGMTQTVKKPWDIAVSSNKEFFITNGTPFVHVYDEDGAYKTRFAAITPEGGASNELRDPMSALHGITMNAKGQLLVGDTNYKYISVLTTSGHHVQSFPVQIAPKFIAWTPLDQVVVSSCQCGPVDIVDMETERTVKTILAPAGESVGQWCPSGVCCGWGELDEILIANQQGKVGIYSFSLEGNFLEFYEDYKDVRTPWGIALSGDDRYLFVSNSDRSGTHIFETDVETVAAKEDHVSSESEEDSGDEVSSL